MEFITLTIVTCIILILIVRFSLNTRNPNPTKNVKNKVILITLVIVSMFLGKFGANWGLPWWIYYPTPMFLVIIFPVILFKMKKSEAARYIIIAIATGPIIHIIFSLFGWKNYMPFIKIPSIIELI